MIIKLILKPMWSFFIFFYLFHRYWSATITPLFLSEINDKQQCINDLLPILYKANSPRDYDYHVGNCTFPGRSSNLQTYGSCPIHATSCGGNETSGVTYEKNICKYQNIPCRSKPMGNKPRKDLKMGRLAC